MSPSYYSKHPVLDAIGLAFSLFVLAACVAVAIIFSLSDFQECRTLHSEWYCIRQVWWR